MNWKYKSRWTTNNQELGKVKTMILIGSMSKITMTSTLPTRALSAALQMMTNSLINKTLSDLKNNLSKGSWLARSAPLSAAASNHTSTKSTYLLMSTGDGVEGPMTIDSGLRLHLMAKWSVFIKHQSSLKTSLNWLKRDLKSCVLSLRQTNLSHTFPSSHLN